VSHRPGARPALAVYPSGEGSYLVADAGDASDWLARFTDGAGFDARAWAEGMVRIYNERTHPGTELPHG
jgi:hypothetical protein